MPSYFRITSGGFAVRLSVEPLESRYTPTTLPTGFAETPVVDGLTRPTAMALAPDGRLFVAEQDGQLRIVRDSQLFGAPFVSLTVDSVGERGLLGVALDPDFTTNNFVYVYYTVPASGGQAPFNRVSRFTAAGDTALAGSEQILVNLDPLSSATNHNGGAIHFGADGKLYVAVGENALPANSQSLTNRLGKILRYNADGSIPADNPTLFAGLSGTTTGANRAIWAVGLRNPFTFATQPGTDRLFINDVGQSSFEEVNAGGPGRNFGWPATEGDFDPAVFPIFTRPAFAYGRGPGNDTGFVIAGATFYNPVTASFPADHVGDYFFADFANDWIRRYDPMTKTAQLFATEATPGLVDFAVTPQGDLLYLSRGTSAAAGQIQRIRFTQPVGPPVPAVVAIAVSVAGRLPVVRTLDPTDGRELGRFDLGQLRPEITTETRAASADVTGDGTADVIVGAGPGAQSLVAVYDGATGAVLTTTTAFEASFTGGVFVAAGDVDGDGKADVIVTPDQGGGPRVRVFRVGGTNEVIADYFGIEDPAFRGGARAAAGDVTGDGRVDVLVAAGFGGGPRVAGRDGRALAAGRLVKVFADFFVFEPTLRNGVFVAAGDLDGDSRADAILGGGPGGGPRVLALGGQELTTNRQVVLGNFFAGDAASRDGVRVAVKNVDANGRPDVVAGVSGRVRLYGGQSLPLGGVAVPLRDFAAAEEGFAGVVFVG